MLVIFWTYIAIGMTPFPSGGTRLTRPNVHAHGSPMKLSKTVGQHARPTRDKVNT